MLAPRIFRPAPRFLALVAGLLALAVTASCYADARTCQHDRDCFSGEVCRNIDDGKGKCVEQAVSADAEPTDTPTTRDTRPRDVTSDEDSSEPDTTGDATTTDADPPDTGPDGEADTIDDPICETADDCKSDDSCHIADCRDGQCIEEPRCEGTDRECGCEGCEDCTERDGWYPTGTTTPCCDRNFGICSCTEQEYRKYYCDGASCEYDITDARTEKSGCSRCSNGCCDDGQCYDERECL